MSAPVTAQSEQFVACVNLPAKLGGVDCPSCDGTVSIKADVDDMSNNTGKGWRNQVGTLKGATADLSLAWMGATGLKIGSIYTLLINTLTMPTPDAETGAIPDPTPIVTGPAFAFDVRVTEGGGPVLTASAGFKLSLKGISEGPVAYKI